MNIDITIAGNRGGGKTLVAEKLFSFLETLYRGEQGNEQIGEVLQRDNLIVTIDSVVPASGEGLTPVREGRIVATCGITVARDPADA